MKDWNLRAILRRIWGEQTRSWRSWAIQKEVDPIEQALWEKRSVEIIKLELEKYIELLRAQDKPFGYIVRAVAGPGDMPGTGPGGPVILEAVKVMPNGRPSARIELGTDRAA